MVSTFASDPHTINWSSWVLNDLRTCRSLPDDQACDQRQEADPADGAPQSALRRPQFWEEKGARDETKKKGDLELIDGRFLLISIT